MQKTLQNIEKFVTLCPRPDGGIGRRVGLKHRWSNPYRFDPGSGHMNLSISAQVFFMIQA